MIYSFESPINLKKIAESGQCFRWEKQKENNYQIVAFDRLLTVEQVDQDTVFFDCSQEEFDQIWSNYFDLKTDYAKISRLITDDDPFIKKAFNYGKGIRILRQDPWEVLISFLISQQKNIPAIKSTIEKLSKIYGREIGEGKYTFPKAKDIAIKGVDLLKECRLGYREKYIRSAVERIVLEPDLLENLKQKDDEKLFKDLQSFYGVGPKVANCIRLFGYNRLNSFPEDVWIKRALTDYYPNGFTFDKFYPYNGIIQQYIFYYYRELNIK